MVFQMATELTRNRKYVYHRKKKRRLNMSSLYPKHIEPESGITEMYKTNEKITFARCVSIASTISRAC